MNQSSNEYFAKVGVKTGVEAELSLDGGVTLNQEVSVEAGWTGNWTSQWQETNRTEAVKSYSDSLTTEASVALDANLSREYGDATVSAKVTIRNTGSLTFTISNILITALLPNPAAPVKFQALATLEPPANGSEYTLAPGSTAEDVRFSAVISSQSLDDIRQAESLVRNPRGVVFRVAYFDLTDQNKKNFAWTTEVIDQVTASVVIDYGGARSASDFRTENLRVATQVWQDQCRWHQDLREPDGSDAGITLRQALELIGLAHYELTGTDRNTDEQDAEKREKSYSTFVDAHGVTRIWRIRNIEPAARQDGLGHPDEPWHRPDEGNRRRHLEGWRQRGRRQAGVRAGPRRRRASCDPRVCERLPRRRRRFRRRRAPGPVRGPGWLDGKRQGRATERPPGRSSLQCNNKDTDGDGLEDAQESVGISSACSDPLIPCFCGLIPCASDPSSRDTDADKLGDKNEQSKLTDFTDFDTDGDSPTVGDGREIELGGNPLVPDFNNFGDDDLDGVPNAVEDSCTYVVAYKKVSPLTGCDGTCPEGAPGSDSPCPASFKNDPDSEGGPGPGGDQVPDDEEYDHLLNPRDADSDHD